MRFFSLLLGVLVAAAQITVLRSLQAERPVFYVEEIATYPTVIFSCDYFYSRKGNLGFFGFNLHSNTSTTTAVATVIIKILC